MATIKRFRTLGLGLALLTCASLQSCATTALWKSGIDRESRAALTPFAIAFDVMTLPIQALALSGRGIRLGSRRRHCHH